MWYLALKVVRRNLNISTIEQKLFLLVYRDTKDHGFMLSHPIGDLAGLLNDVSFGILFYPFARDSQAIFYRCRGRLFIPMLPILQI